MSTMRAVVYRQYKSGPEQLELVPNHPRPTPGPGQLLLRVKATSVNPLDFKVASGEVWPIFTATFPQIPGIDIAGEVVELGANVTDYAVGDRVFAYKVTGGGAAEYATVDVKFTVKIPPNVDYVSAGSSICTGITALQALRDGAELPMENAAGIRVLIVGASGGVGHMAVQIAKSTGATVIGVCSGKNKALVESLGADEVIDYTVPNPYSKLQPVDIVLDCVGQPYSAWLPHLKPNGRYASPVPGPAILLRSAINYFCSQKVRPVFCDCNSKELEVVSKLMASGKVKVVTKSYPLEQLAEAWRVAISNRAVGKLVIEP